MRLKTATIFELFMGSFVKYVRKIFRKTNISNILIRTRTCAYQGVTNVSFSENFAYVLNEWPPMVSSFSRLIIVFNVVLYICTLCVKSPNLNNLSLEFCFSSDGRFFSQEYIWQFSCVLCLFGVFPEKKKVRVVTSKST